LRLRRRRRAPRLARLARVVRGEIGGELDLADSQYQLGAIDSDNGKVALADSLLRRSLAIRTRVLGPDDLAVAEVLERLANNVGYNVSAQEAEAAFRRALAIRRRHAGAGDPRLIPGIAGLLDLNSRIARYRDAEALFREGLALRARAPGDTRCLAGEPALFYEYGLLRYREGQFDDAGRYIDAGIACLEQALGPDHVEVVDHRSALIRVSCEQGRYAEAEQLARRSLAQRRELHGETSPAVDNALHHLAHVLYERDALPEAEAVARDALTRRTGAYGRVHASVASTLTVLGAIQLAAGDATAAEATYRAARAAWPVTLGEDHPEFAEATRGLAEALAVQRRFGEARSTAEQALAMQYRRLEPGHPAIAPTLAVLGAVAQVESPGVAEPRLRAALAIWRAALGPDHPYTARGETLLGECLALQGRTAEALPLLRRGAATLRARLGDAHRDTRLAALRLAAAEPPRAE